MRAYFFTFDCSCYFLYVPGTNLIWYLVGTNYHFCSRTLSRPEYNLMPNYYFKFFFQNPREASSRSTIFLFSLVYVCMYVFIYLCHASWGNEKRHRPEIWYARSPRPYLKISFLFFSKKVTLRAANLEKLPCHVDFPHISSFALFAFF